MKSNCDRSIVLPPILDLSGAKKAVITFHQSFLKVLLDKGQKAIIPSWNLGTFYVDRHRKCCIIYSSGIGVAHSGAIVEICIASGIEEILLFGSCGSIDDRLNIGDILLIKDAIVDEGLSPAYGVKAGSIVSANMDLSPIREILNSQKILFISTRSWTTSSPFMETHARVIYFKNLGAQVVEMECSGLFSICQRYSKKAAALLVVSDRVLKDRWETGFSSKVYKKGISLAGSVIKKWLSGS